MFKVLIGLFALAFSMGQATAVKIDKEIVIDGILENDWDKGIVTDNFIQAIPVIKAKPSKKTISYFLYDDNYIYFAAKNYQSKESINASRGRKDSQDVYRQDYVLFCFDVLNNGNSSYGFYINAKNNVVDVRNNSEGKEDKRWDTPIISSTKIYDDYWTVEAKVPIKTLKFQDRDVQTWGILTLRQYTHNGEYIINHIGDENNLLRVSNYDKINGLRIDANRNYISVKPYVYTENISLNKETANSKNSTKDNDFRFGGELKYKPTNSMSILLTGKPDFAQLEADQDIINISDLPSYYPEKRPFFTESSGFYQGDIAVNSRNISEIDLGLKINDQLGIVKYDITSVRDKEKNLWGFGSVQVSDNKLYSFELQGGLKHHDLPTNVQNDYNYQSHSAFLLFDQRLKLNTYLIGSNGAHLEKDEYRFQQSIKWDTRNFVFNYNYETNTDKLETGIVGYRQIANTSDHWFYGQYKIYGNGFLRELGPFVSVVRNGHASTSDHDYTDMRVGVDANIFLNESLGQYSFSFNYFPNTNRKFRHRSFKTTDLEILSDNISKFVLIDYKRAYINTSISSDQSKKTGVSLSYNNSPWRLSNSDYFSADFFIKPMDILTLNYSISYQKLEGSAFTPKYENTIHYIKANYNFTDKINVRGILQLNKIDAPAYDDYIQNKNIYNLTLTWEHSPGNFAYFIINNDVYSEEDRLNPVIVKNTGTTIAIKASQLFDINF